MTMIPCVTLPVHDEPMPTELLSLSDTPGPLPVEPPALITWWDEPYGVAGQVRPQNPHAALGPRARRS